MDLDGSDIRKRSRSASESSYGSSFGSRSPSPANSDADGHLSQLGDDTPHESVNMDSRLSAGNIGFRLLERMGYKQGQGLGKQGQGRVDPIRINDQVGFMGLGKLERDSFVLDNTALKSKEMASLAMSKETEETRSKREAKLAEKSAIAEEVADILKVFHCQICNKPYKNARQWEEHCNSYEHAHKKRKLERAAELKTAAQTSGEVERRREKERKREEKEMQKMGIIGGFAPQLPNPSISSVTIEPSASIISAPQPKAGFQRLSAAASTSKLESDWSKIAPVASTSQIILEDPVAAPGSSTAAQLQKERLQSIPMAKPSFPNLAEKSKVSLKTADARPAVEWKPKNASGQVQPLHPLLGGNVVDAEELPREVSGRRESSTAQDSPPVSRFRPNWSPPAKKPAPSFNPANSTIIKPDGSKKPTNIFANQQLEDEEEEDFVNSKPTVPPGARLGKPIKMNFKRP